MKFNYQARDTLGASLAGVVEAESREEATRRLESDGLRILELDEAADLGMFSRSITSNEIIYVTSQLAIMVDTGITLSTALGGIYEQADNPTLKHVLGDLRNRVESGEDFSVALARFPRYFDRTFVAMIRASEQTGTLGAMLERISGFLRTQLENRGKVRAALAYPAIMLIVAIGVTIFLLTFILPKFTPLFEKRNIQLPLATRVVMGVSHALVEYWYLWIAGAVAAIVAFLFARKTENGRMAIDGVRIHFPLLGPMLRKVIISRSLGTLGTMIQSGVGMLDAIKMCAEVSGNYWYEKAWMHVVSEITQGARIADSLRGNPLFPKTLVQMLASGEETGRLDYVLAKVSNYYDREVETSIKATTALIEPIMITLMGGVVGTIGMGIMLPIFQLSRGGH